MFLNVFRAKLIHIVYVILATVVILVLQCVNLHNTVLLLVKKSVQNTL